MSKSNRSPGPIADRTFDSAFRVAAIGGLVCVGALFLTGHLSLYDGANVLFTLVLFPVYLIAVATALGVWLGYETDETNLVQVTEEIEPNSEQP